MGVRCDFGAPKVTVNLISAIRRLRQKYTDQLLTLLALFIALEMFVFSPLQAMGIFAFQGFLVATLLAILAGLLAYAAGSTPRKYLGNTCIKRAAR